MLNKAAWRGHLPLLEWMLDEVPGVEDQLFLRDFAGFVPVELAGQAGHDETVAFLDARMRARPQNYRRVIDGVPEVHQHKLRELGLADPNAL